MQVPSHFYSYSFAPNPDWSQKFALQPEIQDYLKTVATKFGIEKHVRLYSQVESAEWDSYSGTWSVKIRNLQTFETTKRRCKVLISAVGALSVPKECELPGASSFQGRIFHTAKWDHTFDWSNKEVVVIGTWFWVTWPCVLTSSKEMAAVQLRPCPS